ncbi:metalloregulator ArsR/SmtB family transcription factor [Blastomonas sp.]|uniref:ArsR/SmtB family transcription factor n=1 Tax=Blastomonas sp. TaxID=1909299 RepID=UPI00261F97DF|nr:metalloregulator ArsR/SmtB family transcription factor [Blastomonas sp.]MDM7956612.1 metalloregulator ArsR/SmtB family transcription factor [Blastomonas sp.]
MTAIHQNRALAEAMTEKLRAYAQPQRLMILSYLLNGESTVGQIDAATGIGQPALSQQLAELRRTELVRTRRAAKQVYYTLADDRTALCVRTMEAMMGDSSDPAGALQQALEIPLGAGSAEPAVRVPRGAAGFARIG